MRYFIFLNLFLTINILSAQEDGLNSEARAKMLEKLEAQRVAFITNKLELTPEESAKFWPLYNEYSKKKQELRREKKNSQQNDTDESVDVSLEQEEKELQLKKTYYEKFKSALPVSKLAKLEEAEKEFKMEVLRTLRERRRDKR